MSEPGGRVNRAAARTARDRRPAAPFRSIWEKQPAEDPRAVTVPGRKPAARLA